MAHAVPRPARTALRRRRQRQRSNSTDGRINAVDAALGPGDRAWNRPGEHSSSTAWRCEACECWVPRKAGGESAWRAHVQGIRHRRQALSLLHTGVRGNLLLSAFERIPEPGAPEHQLVGNASADFGLQVEALRAPGAPGDTPTRIAQLHSAVTKELLHHAGAGVEYKRLSERLSRARLSTAWPAACTRLRGEGRASEGSATFLAAEPALIACVAEALQEMGHISALIIAAAPPVLDLAATTAALVALAHAAARATGLRQLKLTIMPTSARGGQDIIGNQLASALVARVAAALQDTLAANGMLRCLMLKLPTMRHDAVLSESQAALLNAAAGAPAKRRLAVLMSLHPRAGPACFLAWLPMPLLHSIMHAGAPLQGCRVGFQDRTEGGIY
ncbi:hypothetical protein WJX81_007451 [Elliptochloris bilobata]|uniref:Uncharacterized protein n=1 Tax=Elliptochloris bilobata TaxID=381761 RepID=A0AAW1QXC4_9CHLO